MKIVTNGSNKTRNIYNFFSKIIIVIVAGIVLLPIYMIFINSFMNYDELNQCITLSSNITDKYMSIKLIPSHFTFKQYITILLESAKFNQSFWKSFEYSFLITIGQVVLGTMAGFVFSRFDFKGRNVLFFIILSAMLMPFQVTMVPNYIVLNKLGLLNTDSAIILPGVFSAFGMFIMRQFMQHIPDNLVETAQIDGANTYSLFLKILLPQCKSGILALFILCFVDTWNMIEQPLIFLSSEEKMPLSIVIREALNLSPETVFAPCILFIMPAICMFFTFERALIEGVEAVWLGVKK